MKIKIDGTVYEVDKVYTGGYLPEIKCGSMEFYVAEDSEEAGKAARKYWEDMKDNDKAEFRCIIGDERLVQWACGESDSFGISSFEEFLEVTATVPEEQFAGYDGQERECEIVRDYTNDLTSEDWEDHICEDNEYTCCENDQCPPGCNHETWTIETSELHDELGFVPTVAYRHN